VKRIFLVFALLLLLVSCDHQPLEQVLFTSQKVPLEQRQPEHPESLQHTQAGQSLPQQGGVSCYRIPALATAPDGHLLAVCDQRVSSCADLGGNPDINIVIRTSRNHGRTWSDIRSVVDYPFGQSASDPSLIVDHVTGTIFLLFNFMDHLQEPGVYYLRVIKSTDNGTTWSTPEDITSQITQPGWERDFKFITSGRGMQTGSGKLVHTLVNLQKGLYLFASDNHGQSWYLMDTALQPGDESKVIELEDGTWMVNSRVNGAGHRHVHLSSDEGKTWSSKAEASLADPGCNAGLARVGERLFFSNPNSPDRRENLTLRVSDDGGKTWSEGKTVCAGNSAYSSLAVLPGGDVGVLYERDDYNEIVFIRLRESEIFSNKK